MFRKLAFVAGLALPAVAGDDVSVMLAWREFTADTPPHLLLAEPGRELTLSTTAATAMSLTFHAKPKPRIVVAGKSHELPAELESVRFTWRNGNLLARPTRRLAGTIVLGARARPIALCGETLMIDLDGDRVLRGVHEAVRLGAAFGWNGEGYRVERGADNAVRLVALDKPPKNRRPAWRPPPAPVEPHWTVWTRSEEKFAKLKALYRRNRKKHRRAKFPSIFVKRTLHEIGMLRTQQAFGFLWSVATRDPDVRTRAHAVEAMGFPEYARHAAKVERLARRDPDRRPSRIMGSAPTYKVHAAALEALHFMNAPQRLRVYMDLMRSSGLATNEVANTCLRCIGYLGTQESYDLLAERMDAALGASRRDSGLVTALYRGIRHGPVAPDLAWMKAGSNTVLAREAALRDLFALRYPEARSAALELFAERRKSAIWLAEDRELVAEVLAIAGDAAAVRAVLSEPLVSRSATLRRLLPAVREPEAIAVLLEAVGGPHDALVLDVLGGIGVPQVRKALRARLRNTPRPRLAHAVLRAGGDGAVATVVETVRDGGAELRIATAMSLATDQAALEPARALLTAMQASKNATERAAAWSVVPSASGKAFAAALADTDWRVRTAAIRAARRLGHAEVLAGAAPKRLALRAEAARAAGIASPDPAATLAGVAVRSDHVAFVADAHGEALVAKAVRALPDGVHVNVISLRQSPAAWKTAVTPLDTGARASIRRFLRAKDVPAKQRVPLEDAVARAFGDPAVDTVVFVTLGYVRESNSESIRQTVARLDPTRSRTVHVVSRRLDRILEDLAHRHRGTHTLAEERAK